MPAKIAVIGGGKFGEMHLRAFSQLDRCGKAALVGLADLNVELLALRRAQYGVRTYTDFKQMIEREKPDAVAVVTPDFLHRSIALEALGRGCHVLVEKPMDVTSAGCIEMLSAARKKGLLLQVDFHKRYDPYHREAFKAIRAGKIGQVQYCYACMEDRIEVPRDWFPAWAPKSSPLWFLGVHMIDLIRWMVDSDGARVWATANRGKLDALGVPTLDSVQLKVQFQNGVNFALDTSWVLPQSFEAVVNQGIRIVGSEGVIEVDSQDRGSRTCTAAEGTASQNLGFFLEETDKAGHPRWSGYGIESIVDFAENVSFLLDGGVLADLKGIFADGADGLEVTRIAEAAQRSLDTGLLVEIESTQSAGW